MSAYLQQSYEVALCHDVVWIDLIGVHLSESPTCRRRKVNNNITTGLDKENNNYKNQSFH